MRPLSGSQIREDFLRFFEGKGHRRVHSSSLVPHNDPTLLFTNAGMNQFKDVFLGAETRPYTRAVSSQKCIRAGGKHNDLENVGFTRRHHTFFEMLGNFSFGDYFKREAIAYAWELLTSPEWFAIDPARLYVTIFEGNEQVPRDDEAEQFWIETGVPKDRIFEMSAKDNFWQMGETGPCGPCSEIFYDLGLDASETLTAAGTPEDRPFPHDDQRYVEIWNLVFMQFDRVFDYYHCPEHTDRKETKPFTCNLLHKDGGFLKAAIATFHLDSLPRPSIDTGMGLERIACVLQGHLSNYQTDLFTPVLRKADELTGKQASYYAVELITNPSLCVIADHARASTFLIADGVVPSNEGRGYVLRKILRRSIYHGRILGRTEPFMYQMVLSVVEEMRHAYPELEVSMHRISQTVLHEEQQFSRVLSSGTIKLEAALRNTLEAFEDEMRSYVEVGGVEPDAPELDGKAAFSLFETFGLPRDYIEDFCRDYSVKFDSSGFEQAKAEEQARARASWRGGSQKSANPLYAELPKTEFEGYAALRLDGARVLALTMNGLGYEYFAHGDEGEVILDATSFYADSGGQQGDIGYLFGPDHHTVVAEVRGVTKPVQGVFAHKVRILETIAVGDELDTVVDATNRHATERNHTGTHLLHAALRQVLGPHVKQAGSLVNQSRLRFDFSHFAPVADAELQEIEDIVNREVLSNAHVETLVDVPIDEAVRDLGAMALFGEKYGDRVRVVRIGDFSTELCGGTHTRATGEIGLLKLVGESSVASGVRRIEAVSGTGALHEFRRDHEVARVATQFTGGMADPEALRTRLAAQEDELKKLRRDLDQARMKAANASVADAASSAVIVKGIKVLSQRADSLDKGQMRTLVDTLRTKLGSGIVVLGAADKETNRVTLIVGVTKDLTGTLQAGKLVGLLAAQVGGKGGGRPDLAEAGGTDAGKLDATLAQAPQTVAGLLP